VVRLLLKLALLAAIVVMVVEVGLPALGRLRGAATGEPKEVEPGPAECLEAAEQASELVGEVAYAFNPESLAAWRAAEEAAEEAVAAARLPCACEGTGCRRVEQALDELDGVLAAYRSMMDTPHGGFVNPASSLERASNLMAEAQALLE
jgi:hypothetical protein